MSELGKTTEKEQFQMNRRDNGKAIINKLFGGFQEE
jgi:hypothetical protein